MTQEQFEWLRITAQLIGNLFGALLGVFGAIYLYERRVRDERTQRLTTQRNQILLQLATEIETNKHTINQAMERNLRIPAPEPGVTNEPAISDERSVYIAPLFASSFSELLANDLTEHVDGRMLNDLYDYYAKIARANWLIDRVRPFQYRASLINELSTSLREIQDHQDRVLNALTNRRITGG